MTETEPFPAMKLFPGESEAIQNVLDAGAMYGYGNMAAHLVRAWQELLMRSGMDEETALLAVSNTTPYPLQKLAGKDVTKP